MSMKVKTVNPALNNTSSNRPVAKKQTEDFQMTTGSLNEDDQMMYDEL